MDAVSSPIVSVQHISKTFNPSPLLLRLLIRSSITASVEALKDVSFDLNPGEVCAVVGPNGAGKSTLFRILTGLITPSTGTVVVAGLDPVQDGTSVRRVVGFAPAEERTLLLRQTCRENLAFHGLLQGLSGRRLETRISDVLELVGLTGVRDRVGFALSSGMRARLQIARALLHSPPLLILDEPTASVDPQSSLELLSVVQTAAEEQNAAALISSHRLDEIDALRGRIALLNKGHLVHYGDLDQLRATWDRPVIVVRLASASSAQRAASIVRRARDVELVSVEGNVVTISNKREVGPVLALLDGVLSQVLEVGQEKMPLLELLEMVLKDPPQTRGSGSGSEDQ